MKLTKILPSLLVSSFFLPISLNLISCTKPKNLFKWIDVDVWLYFKNQSHKNFSQSLKKKNVVLKDLLYGSLKINKGNYILIIGSETSKETCEFMLGKDNSAIHKKNEWFKKNYDNSTIKKASLDFCNEQNKIPFIFYFDTFYSDQENINLLEITTKNGKVSNFHNVFSNTSDSLEKWISPFAKWKDNSFINQVYKFNLSWDKSQISTNDYIRYDKSAIEYRDFINEAKKLFPTKLVFDTSDFNQKTYLIYYVDGHFKKCDSLAISPAELAKNISNNNGSGFYENKNK